MLLLGLLGTLGKFTFGAFLGAKRKDRTDRFGARQQIGRRNLAGLRPFQIGQERAAGIVRNGRDGAGSPAEAKAMQRQRRRLFATRSQTNLPLLPRAYRKLVLPMWQKSHRSVMKSRGIFLYFVHAAGGRRGGGGPPVVRLRQRNVARKYLTNAAHATPSMSRGREREWLS
jgi:hypothetical protein